MMTRTPTSLAFLAVTLWAILAACSSTSPNHPDGTGGATGGGGMAGVAGGGGDGGHLELCGLAVTCKDGVLSGLWSNFCDPIMGTCPYGCRIANASADPVPTTSEAADAFAQTLCNPPPDASPPDAEVPSDGGDGGD